MATLMALTHINFTKGLPMKIIGPRITVQNTDSMQWQVTGEDMVSASNGLETVNFTVLIPRTGEGMPKVAQMAVKRAIEMLQSYLEAEKSL